MMANEGQYNAQKERKNKQTNKTKQNKTKTIKSKLQQKNSINKEVLRFQRVPSNSKSKIKTNT